MKKAVLALTLLLMIATSCISVLGARQDNTEIKPVLATDKNTTGNAAGTMFKDIKGHWAEQVILRMASKGIINGVGAGLFQPDRNMKRCEFVYLTDKVFDIQIAYFAAPDITDFFEDVKNEDWYSSALYDLTSAGIVDDKTNFRPDEPITREEMVYYIMKAYAFKFKATLNGGSEALSTFSDKDDISKTYMNEVNDAVKLKFIMGRNGRLFDPKGHSTRAEILVVLERVLNAAGKEDAGVKVEPGLEINNDTFKMKLCITNDSGSEVTINHNSSQKYNFVLLDSDHKVLYNWEADKMFAQMLTSTVIAAGKTVEFAEELDMKTHSDIIKKAAYMKAYIVGQSDGFAIGKDGYETDLRSF